MLALVAPLLAVLQLPVAGIAGTVRDAERGHAIAGATVALASAGIVTSTGTDGRYHIASAPAGVQRMVVRYLGRATYVIDAIVPAAGLLELDVTLTVVPQQLPTVAVRSSEWVSPAYRMDGDMRRTIDSRSLAQHPLAAESDVLVALSGGDVSIRPESPSGLSVRGGAPDQLGYALNGIPVLNPLHVAGLIGAWNPDALASAQLADGSTDAHHVSTLGGRVEATTRAPGKQLSVRGATSSTHLRLTLDGPVSAQGAGFLLSLRSAFPTLLGPNDPDYLRGDSGDWLATVTMPMRTSSLQVMATGSDDEMQVSRKANMSVVAGATDPRNTLAWTNQSIGFAWNRATPHRGLAVTGWRAASNVGASWNGDVRLVAMSSRRTDLGAEVTLRSGTSGSERIFGARVEASDTRYTAESATGLLPADSGFQADSRVSLTARTPTVTAFVRQAGPIGTTATWRAGAALTSMRRLLVVDPHASISWTPASPVTFTAEASRTHQFIQSLRNTESLVSHLLPAELYLGAGGGTVPVARSDQLSIRAAVRPGMSTTITLRGYQRTMAGLLAVARGTTGPFVLNAETGLVQQTATVSGVGVDAVYDARATTLLLRYGWSTARYHADGISYTPDYVARHQLDGGVTIRPTSRTTVRLGLTAAIGRRATPVLGPVEWEACNLIDRGCEFGGTPVAASGSLGATILPMYLRTDLSARHVWRARRGRRSAEVAVFGTVTNLLNRANVLNFLEDGASRSALQMRPRAPLVAGVDWVF